MDVSFMSPGGRTGQTARIVGTSGEIVSPPSHGSVAFAFDPSASAAVYTPAAGYVGTDHFEMRVLPGSRLWSVDVRVGS